VSAKDLLERDLSAASRRIADLGDPVAPRDATYTDNFTVPLPDALQATPGRSLLAAPIDHVHPAPVAMRLAAFGTSDVPSRTIFLLATLKLEPGEVLLPTGLVFASASAPPLSLAGSLSLPQGPDAPILLTWHICTANEREFAFVAFNTTADVRPISWASLALRLAP